jgi:dihydroorotase-like cyclic amidohydrolase
VELILPLMQDAIARRGFPLALLTRLLCEAPARRFGLWLQKGRLAPGEDADIVVLDPDETWVVDPGALTTPTGWSPYTGRPVRGRVRQVIARGAPTLDENGVSGEPGRGAYVVPRRSGQARGQKT